MSNRRPRNWYTVWDSKTDELIASGTARNCAKILGVTRDSFLSIVSRCQKGKQKKYTILKENYK